MTPTALDTAPALGHRVFYRGSIREAWGEGTITSVPRPHPIFEHTCFTVTLDDTDGRLSDR